MSNTVQTFDRNRIGFITPMYWGGGEDGDGRDMTGSAPLRRSASFIADCSGHESGANLREMAVEFTTPEDLLIALEEEMAERHNGVRKPKHGPQVRVNGQLLDDFLEGKPVVGPLPLPLFLMVTRPRRRHRRRRGGRGRGNGHAGNNRR